MKQLITLFLGCLSIALPAQDKPCSLEYRHMAGIVGDMEAVADITVRDDRIEGSIVFPGLKVSKGVYQGLTRTQRLQGSIDDQGVAVIEAYEGNINTGEYSGLLGDAFRGTYREDAGGIISSFSFEEDMSGSIRFNGYCIKMDSSLLDTADTPFAHLDMALLLPLNGDSLSYIRDRVLDAFFYDEIRYDCPDHEILEYYSDEYYKQYIESNIDIYDGGYSFNWEMIGTAAIGMNRLGLLVYRADTYGYTGGAHGMGVSRFMVFDLPGGRQLTPGDIFVPGFERELGGMLERAYRAMYFVDESAPLSEAGLFDDHIAPSENFWISENGMSFFYNPYELAPYSMGSITISLPYTMFDHLLRDDAPVRRLGW